jgi:PDZ domain-containing secreted protein
MEATPDFQVQIRLTKEKADSNRRCGIEIIGARQLSSTARVSGKSRQLSGASQGGDAA